MKDEGQKKKDKQMKSNYATKEEIINVLEMRDNMIKCHIDKNIKSNVLSLINRIKEIEKNIENLTEEVEELSKKVNKEIDINRNIREELEHYHYTLRDDETVILFENKELFKEWFLDNVYKKRAFEANSKAWDAIYEAIGKTKNVEVAEENNN